MSYVYPETSTHRNSYIYGGKEEAKVCYYENEPELSSVKHKPAHHNLTVDELLLKQKLLDKAAETEALFDLVKVGKHHDRAIAAFKKSIRLIIEELTS